MEASYSHFFIGIDFNWALLENVKLGKLVLIGLQSPREWKNRTRLDEGYFFYYLIPPEDIIWKKDSGRMKQQSCESSDPYSPKKVRKVGKSRSITNNTTSSLANITDSLTNSITYIPANPSKSGNIPSVPSNIPSK